MTVRRFVINCSLNTLVICLNLLIVAIIHKARLKHNRHFLVQILSGLDAMYAVFTVFMSVPLFFMAEGNFRLYLIDAMNLIMYTLHALSLQTFTLISIDRYIAAAYGLSYHRILPKKKLIRILLSLLAFDVTLNLVLIIFSEAKNNIYKTSRCLMIFFLIFRSVTCITIMITGRLAVKARKANIERVEKLRPSVQLHGENAEHVSTLKQMNISLKDVMVLNFWFISLLVPLIIFGALEIIYNVNQFGAVIILLIVGGNIFNPLIYVFTQRDIKGYIKKRFRQYQCAKDQLNS